MPDIKSTIELTIQKPDYTEFNENLKRLAERLGVEPCSGDISDFMISADPGENYSVMKLCHAFLNRMEAADRQPERLREAVALCAGNAMPVSFEGQPRVSIRRDLFDELLEAFNEIRIRGK